MKKIAIFTLAASITSGCVSLSPSDASKLNELRSVGISEEAVTKKSPAAAGALNLLPGVGNFYLATGTREGSQWTYGFLNLLFWPLSIVWAIPQAAVDAQTINKMETVYYYTYNPDGKRQFEARKASLNPATPVTEQSNQNTGSTGF